MDKQKLTTRLIVMLFLFVAISCTGKSKKADNDTVLKEASLIEVSIGGMSCLDCEQTIQNNVGKLEGIKSVKASFTAGTALVEYFPSKVDTTEIKEAVTGSGYTVKRLNPLQPDDAAR